MLGIPISVESEENFLNQIRDSNVQTLTEDQEFYGAMTPTGDKRHVATGRQSPPPVPPPRVPPRQRELAATRPRLNDVPSAPAATQSTAVTQSTARSEKTENFYGAAPSSLFPSNFDNTQWSFNPNTVISDHQEGKFPIKYKKFSSREFLDNFRKALKNKEFDPLVKQMTENGLCLMIDSTDLMFFKPQMQSLRTTLLKSLGDDSWCKASFMDNNMPKPKDSQITMPRNVESGFKLLTRKNPMILEICRMRNKNPNQVLLLDSDKDNCKAAADVGAIGCHLSSELNELSLYFQQPNGMGKNSLRF